MSILFHGTNTISPWIAKTVCENLLPPKSVCNSSNNSNKDKSDGQLPGQNEDDDNDLTSTLGKLAQVMEYGGPNWIAKIQVDGVNNNKNAVGNTNNNNEANKDNNNDDDDDNDDDATVALVRHLPNPYGALPYLVLHDGEHSIRLYLTNQCQQKLGLPFLSRESFQVAGIGNHSSVVKLLGFTVLYHQDDYPALLLQGTIQLVENGLGNPITTPNITPIVQNVNVKRAMWYQVHQKRQYEEATRTSNNNKNNNNNNNTSDNTNSHQQIQQQIDMTDATDSSNSNNNKDTSNAVNNHTGITTPPPIPTTANVRELLSTPKGKKIAQIVIEKANKMQQERSQHQVQQHQEEVEQSECQQDDDIDSSRAPSEASNTSTAKDNKNDIFLGVSALLSPSTCTSTSSTNSTKNNVPALCNTDNDVVVAAAAAAATTTTTTTITSTAASVAANVSNCGATINVNKPSRSKKLISKTPRTLIFDTIPEELSATEQENDSAESNDRTNEEGQKLTAEVGHEAHKENNDTTPQEHVTGNEQSSLGTKPATADTDASSISASNNFKRKRQLATTDIDRTDMAASNKRPRLGLLQKFTMAVRDGTSSMISFASLSAAPVVQKVITGRPGGLHRWLRSQSSSPDGTEKPTGPIAAPASTTPGKKKQSGKERNSAMDLLSSCYKV